MKKFWYLFFLLPVIIIVGLAAAFAEEPSVIPEKPHFTLSWDSQNKKWK